MNRRTLKALFVDDNDLSCECKKENLTLDDIVVGKLGFVAGDLDKYDIIIYTGRLGRKIVKL